MFWKKKCPETDTISWGSEDKRNAYRYHFKNGQGLQIKFKGKMIRLINISAGGLAFENMDFQEFDFDFIRFSLDIPNFMGDPLFFSGLRILKIDANNTCHCLFEGCALEQHELLHKYVLEMQKHDLAH